MFFGRNSRNFGQRRRPLHFRPFAFLLAVHGLQSCRICSICSRLESPILQRPMGGGSMFNFRTSVHGMGAPVRMNVFSWHLMHLVYKSYW